MSDDVFHRLREEYSGTPLDERTVAREPRALFDRWFEDAVRAGIRLANGMTLATVGPDGQPSARVVLLKSIDESGLVFFTNYRSRKARDLAWEPKAALLFWWMPLERQVRIEGTVEQVAGEVSDEYFASRPRPSNLSAMASPQSDPVPDRRVLEDRVSELEAEWRDRELTRPAHWGGYRLLPEMFEFWQGRPDRLHDRIRYQRADDGSWQISRLAP